MIQTSQGPTGYAGGPHPYPHLAGPKPLPLIVFCNPISLSQSFSRSERTWVRKTGGVHLTYVGHLPRHELGFGHEDRENASPALECQEGQLQWHPAWGMPLGHALGTQLRDCHSLRGPWGRQALPGGVSHVRCLIASSRALFYHFCFITLWSRKLKLSTIQPLAPRSQVTAFNSDGLCPRQ